MKRILSFVAVSLMAILCMSEVSAQVRFGFMAGANFNKASIKLDDYKTGKNMTGYQLGPVVEYDVNLGVATVGVESALLFTQKSVNLDKPLDQITGKEALEKIAGTFKSNYIEIPVNAKVYFGVAPAVRMFVKAGPSFNFNISKKEVEIASVEVPDFNRKVFNLALQAGIGVEVLKMVQVSAGYSASMLPDYKYEGVKQVASDFLNTKNKGFYLTAAVLF